MVGPRRHGAPRGARKSAPTTGAALRDGLQVTAYVLILLLCFFVMVFIMVFNILVWERVQRIRGIPVISAGGVTVFILSFNTLERGREMEILGLGLCHPTMVQQAIHQSATREVMNRQVRSRTCRSFLFFQSLPGMRTHQRLLTRRGLALGRGLHSMRLKTLWSRR